MSMPSKAAAVRTTPTTNLAARARSAALHPIKHPPTARLATVSAMESRVALTDPAMTVVTDFRAEHPVTVAEDCLIDHALLEMKRANVRSMLVLRGDQISGLVTSYDIQGERPMKALLDLGFKTHAEIEVRHIMLPWDSVPTLELGTVRDAKVHQVIDFFRNTPEATHLLIVEHGANGAVVRGLISRARVERQVGLSIN